MPANRVPAAKVMVHTGTISELPKARVAAEWIQRLRQIALYFLLIGATIALSTLLAHWIHRR